MVNVSDIKNKLGGIINNPKYMKEYFISTVIIIMIIVTIVLVIV